MDIAPPLSLQSWIESVLIRSITELNRVYWRTEQAAIEIEPLYHNQPHIPIEELHRTPPPATLAVADALLHQLHTKLHRRRCETAIWAEVILRLRQPLPSEIAHELLDRLAYHLDHAMQHSRQNDDVQWRLATRGREALLTLAVERYALPDFSVADLDEVLTKYPHSHWMLDTLAHWHASSLEKEQAWLRVATQHPDRESFLRKAEHWWSTALYTNPVYSSAEFHTLLDGLQDNYLLLKALAIRYTDSPEKEQAYLAAVQSHPQADELTAAYTHSQQVKHAKEAGLDAAAFDQLYSSGDQAIQRALADNLSLDVAAYQRLYATENPDIWWALAGNSALPTSMLLELTEVTGIERAHQIRTAARLLLRTRPRPRPIRNDHL